MPTTVLRSARNQYRRQQRVAALALAAASREFQRGNLEALTSVVAAHQVVAAEQAAASVAEMLAEQLIPNEPVGAVQALAFAGLASDGRSLQGLLELAQNSAQLALMVLTQVNDASRVAAGVATAVRPTVQGHVRYLNPPSCGRCAVLAGRFYRWSDAFLRHPQCDCVMIPSDREAAKELIADPKEAFEKGQIRGLSNADEQAVMDGADLNKVINLRRSAGLSAAGGRVLTRVERGNRFGRITPEGIYKLADGDRDRAIEYLRRAGYITT